MTIRKLHRWIGLYIIILTLIWITEAIALPIFFGSGLPTVNDAIPAPVMKDNTAFLSLEEAMQSFMDQHPDGINSANEIDAITYFPNLNVYQLQNRTRYFDWYIHAQNGKLIKYGFNKSFFLEKQGLLRWLHPWIGNLIQFFSFLLTLLLIVSGFLLFVNSFLTQKAQRREL